MCFDEFFEIMFSDFSIALIDDVVVFNDTETVFSKNYLFAIIFDYELVPNVNCDLRP